MARGRLSRRKNPLKRRPTTNATRNPVDHGTPELTAHRLREHGMPDVTTEHPVDALAAKGLLCPCRAGEETGDWMARNVVARDTVARLAALHRALHGSSTAPAIDPDARGGSGSLEEAPKDVRMEQEYRAMRKALMDKGRRIFDAVMNRAVYCRKMPPAESPHWHAELAALRIGVDALLGRGQRSASKAA